MKHHKLLVNIKHIKLWLFCYLNKQTPPPIHVGALEQGKKNLPKISLQKFTENTSLTRIFIPNIIVILTIKQWHYIIVIFEKKKNSREFEFIEDYLGVLLISYDCFQ